MKFEFSGALYRFVDYSREVEVPGDTLQEGLDGLIEQYPRLQRTLLDQNGQVGKSHQLFINGQQLDRSQTSPAEMAMKSDDVVYVLTAITGG